MAYGLLPTGFALKPLDVIKSEIEAYQLANVSPALNLEADSPLGQINGIVAAKIAELWEVAQAVYSSQYPDSASGIALDNVASLTGAARLAATKSAVIVTCTGTPGTILPAGRVVSVDPGGARFASVAGAVIGGGGTVAVAFEAEETGPIVANSGTLTEIETPVSGWASATNALDERLGRAIESDEELRVRRVLLLEEAGDAALEAIRAEVLDVTGVTECFVYENDSDATDGDGVPPHSIEVVVTGGADADIRDAIFNSKAAGIQAYGTTSGTVTDSQNIDHTIAFTRPTARILEINVTVLTDPALFPVSGATMIAASLAFLADAWRIADDVIRNKLFEAVFKSFDLASVNGDQPPIPGVIDVTVLEIRFNPPGGAFGTGNLAVGTREIATLDTSDVTVTVTP